MEYKDRYPLYIAHREANAGLLLVSEGLSKDDSFEAIRCKVAAAISANIMAGVDMDCDGDGTQDALEGAYAYIQDMYAGQVVYSMSGSLFQCDYTIDGDGDAHLGTPQEVEVSYVPAGESFAESYGAGIEEMVEAAGTPGNYTITVIKPGVSKNNRYYSPELLKGSYKIFEGCKMFADHASDKEMKDRPEGSVNNWVANLTKVWAESNGTIRGNVAVIDPAFDLKLGTLKKHGLLDQMGVSIRAMGEANDGEFGGKKVKIVESLVKARSVDFVTFAGAGGQVEDLQ